MKLNNELVVFSGNNNKQLAKDICRNLKISLGRAMVSTFSDGETRVEIEENVRGKDAFAVQSTSCPADKSVMELLILIDALRRASAKRITAVIPYFGYARQDRKDKPRVPITAKLVANILRNAGADRILTIDLHAGQIQGFFDIPLDHLFAVNIFVKYFKAKKLKNLVVVSPDVGGIKMARAYSKAVHADLAIVDKRRINDSEAEVMNILGQVKGKNVVIVDDIVATAGSLVEAAKALKNSGALKIYAAITHPVLCGPAIDRIRKSPIEEIVVTDTIAIPKEKRISKIKQLSTASLLSDAITRIHTNKSISILFAKNNLRLG